MDLDGKEAVAAKREETEAVNREETEAVDRKDTVDTKRTVKENGKETAVTEWMDGSIEKIKCGNDEPAQQDKLDEKSMIMEQDRLLRDKKRKKNRKKRRVTGGILLLCAAGGAWYLIWGRKLTQTDKSSTVQVIASAGQEIVYARLDSVNGNEISYTLAEQSGQGEEQGEVGAFTRENSGEGTSQTGNGEADAGRHWQETGDGQEASHIQDTADKPDKTDMEEQSDLPDKSELINKSDVPQMAGMMGDREGRSPGASGNFAEGSVGGASGDLSGGSMGGESGGFEESTVMGAAGGMQYSGAFTYNNIVYRLTEETAQAMIPVGTPVTTRLGTVTTFSRLAAGDYVALVMEENGSGRVIAAVYIVG